MHAAARPQNRIGLQTWQSERCTDKESQIISALSCHVVQPHPVCPWGWHPSSAADFSQPANPCPASITEARRASKETKWATDQTMRERSENEKDTQNERQRERERARARETDKETAKLAERLRQPGQEAAAAHVQDDEWGALPPRAREELRRRHGRETWTSVRGASCLLRRAVIRDCCSIVKHIGSVTECRADVAAPV